MPYVVLADIEGRIPADYLTQALDDDGDGEADAWDKVAADAASAVDALVGMRYTVPVPAPYPALITEAAKVAACYLCYQRRGTSDETNPWRLRYDTYFGANGILSRVASGKLPLAPELERVKPSGSLISEPATTYDRRRRRLT
jgi:phage gp36-like protein